MGTYKGSWESDARIGHFSPDEHRCGEASRMLEGKPAPKQSHTLEGKPA